MDNSTEAFSCCGFHPECTKQGKCVRTHYWVNYAKICSWYKNVISKMGIKKVKKVKKVKT